MWLVIYRQYVYVESIHYKVSYEAISMSSLLQVSERVVDHMIAQNEYDLEGRFWPWAWFRRSGRVHNSTNVDSHELVDLISQAPTGYTQCTHPMANFLFYGEDGFVLRKDTTRFDFDLFDQEDVGPTSDRPVAFRTYHIRQTQADRKITTICDALNESVSCQVFSVIMGYILRLKQQIDQTPVCFNVKCLRSGGYESFTRAVVAFMFDTGYRDCGNGMFNENGSSNCLHWARKDDMFYLYISSDSEVSAVVVNKTASGIYVCRDPRIETNHTYYIPFYDELTFRITDTICDYDTLDEFERALFHDTVPNAIRCKYISDITDLSDSFTNMRLRGICKCLNHHVPMTCVLITKFIGGVEGALPNRSSGDSVITVQYERQGDDDGEGVTTFLWYELTWRVIDYDLILKSYDLKHTYSESQLPYPECLKIFPAVDE